MKKHRHYTGYGNHRIAHSIKMIFLIFCALVTIFPFFWVILASFKQSDEIYANPLGIPQNFVENTVKNYSSAWILTKAPSAFFNSLIYSLASIFVILVLSSMVSFVISRVIRGKWLFAYFSLGIMVPIQALIIPLNIVLKNFGMLDSRAGIITAFVVSNISFSVFIIAAFIRGIPHELEDAAFIDGCARSQVFFRIIVPISKAALATAATFCFINCWNDLLLSMTILQSTALSTLNLAVYHLKGEFTTDYGEVTAGIVMLIIPAMIMYIIFQEQIIKGMISGAVKG
jgi:raffinose/stachyose/melibiose transport system permease protein